MPNTALNFIRSNNLSSSHKESNKTKSPQSCKCALKRLSQMGYPNGTLIISIVRKTGLNTI